MKLLVLSDIHANIIALETVCRLEADADLIYCAGDLVDYGPFPREVIAFVQSHKIITVQGNHDAAVAATWQELCDLGRSDPQRGYASLPPDRRAWRHHNAALLTPDDIAYLHRLPAALRFAHDGHHYAMTHLFRGYDTLETTADYDAFVASRFTNHEPPHPLRVILGHTHIPTIRHLCPARSWLNPGSLSYRHQGDATQGAHYLTITDGVPELRFASYDHTLPLAAVLQTQLQPSERQVAEYFFRAPTN